jgi:hypothetical protein
LKGQPALMNVQTCRNLWHAGIGNDGPPEWNRFEITKDAMIKIGLGDQAIKIEEQATAEIGKLWEKQLQILYAS